MRPRELLRAARALKPLITCVFWHSGAIDPESMEINENQRNSTKAHPDQQNSTEIIENGPPAAPPASPGAQNAYNVCVFLHSGAIDPKSTEINEDQRKSTQINEV